MKSRASLLLPLMLFLNGCAGGLDCPIDRPACCDNVLFGCGPFDLPVGCSCSSYFSLAPAPNRAFSSSTPQTYAGQWQFSLSKVASSCPGVSSIVNIPGLVRQNRNRVTLIVPGYGTAKGSARGKSVHLKGVYGQTPLGCAFTFSAIMSKPNGQRSAVQASVHMSCLSGAQTCDATYAGKGKRR